MNIEYLISRNRRLPLQQEHEQQQLNKGIDQQQKILDRQKMSMLPPLLVSPKSAATLQLPSLYPSRLRNKLDIQNTRIEKARGYEERLMERLPMKSMEQYEGMSSMEINKEYFELKQELRKISKQVNRLIDDKHYKLKKDKKNHQELMLSKTSSASRLLVSSFQSQLNSSASHAQLLQHSAEALYEGYERNNSKIFDYQRHELKKLLEREAYITESRNPNGKKEELCQNIQKIKEQIKEETKAYKELQMESNRLGEDIINTDGLIDEIKKLENELSVLMIRKKKLTELYERNEKGQDYIEQGKIRMVVKSQLLHQYEHKEKITESNARTLSQLKSLAGKKQRAIAALKRDIQSKDRLNSKRYYELLMELNEMEKRSEGYGARYELLETKFALGNHEYEDMRIEYEQVMARNRKVSPQVMKKNSNEQSSFLTQIQQNVEQTRRQPQRKMTFLQTKQDLQSNRVSGKEMMREIEENLLKTQKNLQKIDRQSLMRVEITSQIQKMGMDQGQNEEKQNIRTVDPKKKAKGQKVPKGHSKKVSQLKKYDELSDSEILEEEDELEASKEQRFREKQFTYGGKESTIETRG